MKLSIVIPAYNEEKRIKRTLDAYSNYFESLRKKKELDYSILVVVNNSKDKTEEIVKNFSTINKRIKCLVTSIGGKGSAIKLGFNESIKSNFDLIGFVDADMATEPSEFYKLVKFIGNADGVIAGRYSKGSQVFPKQSLPRIFVSRIYNLLIRCLFLLPYRDTQCGAKIFKKIALQESLNSIGMTRWAFDLELIYRIRENGFVIKETPTKWSDQEYSTINFKKSGPWMVLAVIRLRLLTSPLKIFINFYDKFIKILPK
jgi:glycosyltransferase involved in cell wall biosynthesis